MIQKLEAIGFVWNLRPNKKKGIKLNFTETKKLTDQVIMQPQELLSPQPLPTSSPQRRPPPRKSFFMRKERERAQSEQEKRLQSKPIVVASNVSPTSIPTDKPQQDAALITTVGSPHLRRDISVACTPSVKTQQEPEPIATVVSTASDQPQQESGASSIMSSANIVESL